MDELLAAFWNRDAYEIAEQHPPRAIEVTDNAQSVSVAGKAGLDITVLIRRSEAIGYSELLSNGFRREFQDVVDHGAVRDWSLASGRRFL